MKALFRGIILSLLATAGIAQGTNYNVYCFRKGGAWYLSVFERSLPSFFGLFAGTAYTPLLPENTGERTGYTVPSEITELDKTTPAITVKSSEAPTQIRAYLLEADPTDNEAMPINMGEQGGKGLYGDEAANLLWQQAEDSKETIISRIEQELKKQESQPYNVYYFLLNEGWKLAMFTHGAATTPFVPSADESRTGYNSDALGMLIGADEESNLTATLIDSQGNKISVYRVDLDPGDANPLALNATSENYTGSKTSRQKLFDGKNPIIGQIQAAIKGKIEKEQIEKIKKEQIEKEQKEKIEKDLEQKEKIKKELEEKIKKEQIEKEKEEKRKKEDCKTPLSKAVSDNNLPLVKYLVEECGADINAIDKSGYTPLARAATRKDSKILNYLIETKKADLNKQDKKGNTALIWAIRSSNKLENAELLISTKKVDVNQANNAGETPLWWAMWANRLDIVKYLVENGHADITKIPSPLPRGVNEEITKYLESQKERKEKIEKRQFTKEDCKTPLSKAISDNNLPLVKYLVENCDADVNAIDKDGYTPLGRAATRKDSKILNYLIETKKADLNKQDKKGNTALIWAIRSSNKLENAELLISTKKVDVNQANNAGETPLWWAMWANRLDIVKYLVENGHADITKIPSPLPRGVNEEITKYLKSQEEKIEKEKEEKIEKEKEEKVEEE